MRDEKHRIESRNRGIAVLGQAKVADLKISPSGEVQGIVYEVDNKLYTTEVEAVFLAPPIRPDWSQVGGEQTASRLKSDGVFYLSGLTNSIPYNAYAELASDGIRTAELLLT